MARPLKLTRETRATITRELAAGASTEVAARAAGVSGRTLRRWLRRGRDGDGAPYTDLVDAIDQAKADAVTQTLERIGRAADHGDWRAAAWLLETLFPDEFGLSQR